MDSSPLDVKSLPEHERVAFYAALFALANVDGESAREELNLIFETLDLDGLSEAGVRTVHDYAHTPPSLAPSLDALRHADERLRFGLALGLYDVAVADDVVTDEEQAALDEASTLLGVNAEQKAAIERFAREAKRIRERGLDDDAAAKAIKTAGAGLAGVGVPIAAIYFSGSVVGLGAAGITSGLAALGLGGLLGLGAMVSGIGVVALLGAGLFWGIRKLTDADGTNAKEVHQQERERKAQLVIKNLQETIAHIIDRMTRLEVSADESAANRRALDDLRGRLTSLQKILRQREANVAND